MTPEQIKEKFPIGSRWFYNDKKVIIQIVGYTTFGFAIYENLENDNVYVLSESLMNTVQPYTMTKAKEALGWLNDVDGTIGEPEHKETIRKALELLDKVEQGGLDVNVLEKPKGMTLDEKIGFMECRAIVQAKYILIERE